MRYRLRTLLLIPLLLLPLFLGWWLAERPFTPRVAGSLVAALVGYVAFFSLRQLLALQARSPTRQGAATQGAVTGLVFGALYVLTLEGSYFAAGGLQGSAELRITLLFGTIAVGALLGTYVGVCAGVLVDLYLWISDARCRRSLLVNRKP